MKPVKHNRRLTKHDNKCFRGEEREFRNELNRYRLGNTDFIYAYYEELPFIERKLDRDEFLKLHCNNYRRKCGLQARRKMKRIFQRRMNARKRVKYDLFFNCPNCNKKLNLKRLDIGYLYVNYPPEPYGEVCTCPKCIENISVDSILDGEYECKN